MFVAFILSKIHTYCRYRETRLESTQFTNREVEDLGLSRYEINAMAGQNTAS